MENLIARCRNQVAYGIDIRDVYEDLIGEHSAEDIFLAWQAAKLLCKWGNEGDLSLSNS